MSRQRTYNLLAVVFVVLLAMSTMSCPEQMCFDCGDDDLAVRSVLTALVPAAALVPERIEAPVLLGHSYQHKRVCYLSATHPALVARLLI